MTMLVVERFTLNDDKVAHDLIYLEHYLLHDYADLSC